MDPVEEIKSRLDVAEVVGGYIPLKQAGRNLKAPCPFHNEKTASLMVSPEKGIWHCFGCGEGGDIFTFVQKIDGLDFRGALEQLARKAGVELTDRPKDTGAAKLRQRLYEAHALAVRYYQASLLKNAKALSYLKDRGITRQSIKDFGIGYAPETWEGLTKALTKQGFTAAELVAAGLAGQKQGIYDQFRGRIMLPIGDREGRIIGFTGRVLGDELPKYLNTPQTALYDKSRAIYGWHLAKDAIRTAGEAVLVEGNMDVVASHQAGVKNVVAASGTALTMEQLKALKNLSSDIKIKLCFDRDRAGLAATERAIPLAQKLGINLFAIEIPEGKDPDELIKIDPAKWRLAIEQAPEIRQYWLDRSMAEFDLTSLIGKQQFVRRMQQILVLYGDKSEQELFASHIAEVTGIPAETILSSIGTVEAFDPTMSKPSRLGQSDLSAEQSEDEPASGLVVVEEMVLAINLAYPAVRLSLDDLSEVNFTGSQRPQIYKALKEAAPDTTADKLEQGLPDGQAGLQALSNYVKILTLRGEEEFTSLAPADRSLEAFRLARRLQTLSNKRNRHLITEQLRAAENSGDIKLAAALREQYQTLISADN